MFKHSNLKILLYQIFSGEIIVASVFKIWWFEMYSDTTQCIKNILEDF